MHHKKLKITHNASMCQESYSLLIYRVSLYSVRRKWWVCGKILSRDSCKGSNLLYPADILQILLVTDPPTQSLLLFSSVLLRIVPSPVILQFICCFQWLLPLASIFFQSFFVRGQGLKDAPH